MDGTFKKYELMKTAGASPERVFLQAARDGIDPITRIRLIRAVFSLTLGKAKEVVVRVDGEAKSLDEHQANIATAIKNGVTSHPLAEK
jgi:hypothetical protein